MYPQLHAISLGPPGAVLSAGPFILTGRKAVICTKILEGLTFLFLIDARDSRRGLCGFVLRSIYFVSALAERF